jgi:hypothetical protein
LWVQTGMLVAQQLGVEKASLKGEPSPLADGSGHPWFVAERRHCGNIDLDSAAAPITLLMNW